MKCEVEESPRIKACGTVDDVQIIGFFIAALYECVYIFKRKVEFFSRSNG